jgi:hypothetical protein
VTDSYSGELPLKGDMKILPAGRKDNARKHEGLTERIYYNPPEQSPLKVEIKSPSIPISPEKKINLWNDQRGDFEKIRKKLEEVLSQTTGMASITACAHLLGMYIFLRSISNKQCLNMAESILKAVIDGIKETAEKKDMEMPSIKIKLKVG